MRFFPIAGTEGNGAGATIEGGEYSLAEDEGLAAGQYRVSIVGLQETGRKLRNQEPRPGEPKHYMETVQYIPQNYNIRTRLQVTLNPGVNQEDFDLEPK